MDRTIRLGLLKCIPVRLGLDENMECFERYARGARRQGVELLVTCEGYLDGYYIAEEEFDRKTLFSVGQELNSSPYLEAVRRIGREYSLHVVFGFVWKSAEEVRNSAIFVDSSGRDIGLYSKTHLVQREREEFVPGDDLPVFQSDLGLVGIMLCADRRWPEVARTFKLRGADFIINPSLGRCDLANEWMMRTRAYENEIHIAFSHGRVGLLCGPKGELLAKLDNDKPGLLVCDVDLSRRVENMLPKRRPELYSPITDNE